jgi:AAA domain
VDLRVRDDVDELIDLALAHRPSTVVLDTLNRCMPGGDENSSSDMGKFIAGVENLTRLGRTGVMAIHHTGKDGKDPRGHSSLTSAADAMISCRAGDGGVRVKLEKQRRGPAGLTTRLRPFVHEVEPGTTACLVEPLEDDVDAPQTDSARDEIVRGALRAGALQRGALETTTGITGGTLSRVLNRLVETGKLRKEGKLFYVVD